MDSPSARTELVSELFVRGLGLVLASAFCSLGVQVVGLLGAHGITPAADFLAHVKAGAGASAALHVPTWFLLCGAGDRALRVVCFAGFACGLLVAARCLTRVALFAAWSLYLSLCAVGSVFLQYQWDALLLETALVGLFVATPGSSLGIWLARVLCLKLMLLSGLVKLLSGDPTWRDLSALSYHWWTQPLPTWPAVLASELPRWLQSGMTLAALLIELVAPLAIFGPRRARLVACAALAALQLVIAATGNYGFFNLLSLLLCGTLLDDAALRALTPRVLQAALQRWADRRARALERSSRWPLLRTRRTLYVASGSALLAVSMSVGVQALSPLPAAIDSGLASLRPLRSVNRYGLFAVMTTERLEIALEGSRDGGTWQRYTFRWKPGALDRRPRFAPLHMPRLDWQMWFASLSRCEQQPWLLKFLTRVLTGAPEVLELLEHNPFPEAPPRFLRTPLASYHFAPNAQWLHGVWWVREPVGYYCPAVMLRDGVLVRAAALDTRAR